MTNLWFFSLASQLCLVSSLRLYPHASFMRPQKLFQVYRVILTYESATYTNPWADTPGLCQAVGRSRLLSRASLSSRPRFANSPLVQDSGARHTLIEPTSVPLASLKRSVRANCSSGSVKLYCMLPICGAPAASPSLFNTQGKNPVAPLWRWKLL